MLTSLRLRSVAAAAVIVSIAALLTSAGPAKGAATSAPGPLATGPQLATVYYPITPCRIVDTRRGTGINSTPFGNGTTRNLFVVGTTNIAAQGGHVGGCGIPTAAAALDLTITAVTPTRTGFLRAWPAGELEPNSTLLNYGTFSMGTGATVKIASGGSTALAVKNYNGPTDIVIDAAGYYAPPMKALIRVSPAHPTGVLAQGSSRAVSLSSPMVGSWIVTFDTDISFCSVQSEGLAINEWTQGYSQGGNTALVKMSVSAGAFRELASFDVDVTVVC